MLEIRTRGFLASAYQPQLAGTGLLFAVALATLAGAWLIVRGWGPAAGGGFVLLVFYLGILVRWQRGVYGLLGYLPFAGVVTLALYPWEGPAVFNPVLYKDWLFVVPAYLGFLAAMVLRRERAVQFGGLPSTLLLAFSVLVLAQMANPGVPNLLSGLIGAKVWLLYLPLYVLTTALVASRRDLVFLLRFLVVLTAIPCAVGIVEYVLAQFLGYQELMESVYGDVAIHATQGFTSFQVGGGLLARIPSTFSFVTQFFGYTLAMLVPCYAVWRTDTSTRWRRLGKWMLGVAAVASFLSGARAAFLFVPLLLALTYGIDRGFSGVVRVGPYIAGVIFGALVISHIAAIDLYQHVTELFGGYARETAYGELARALASAPLGMGTGTNTGAARYAFSDPSKFVTLENYYAKATYELGIPGLLILWGLFGALIRSGFQVRRQLRDPGLRGCSAAFLAFLITMALNSFKGWLVDLDPINVYFWVFSGVLARFPYLDSHPGESGRTPTEESQ